MSNPWGRIYFEAVVTCCEEGCRETRRTRAHQKLIAAAVFRQAGWSTRKERWFCPKHGEVKS